MKEFTEKLKHDIRNYFPHSEQIDFLYDKDQGRYVLVLATHLTSMQCNSMASVGFPILSMTVFRDRKAIIMFQEEK